MRVTIFLFTLFILACHTEPETAFQKLKPAETGVYFENEVTDEAVFNVLKYGYFYNGGGVAVADFNNDGFSDLYLTGNVMQDQLYLNKGTGEISFENITQTAGIGTEKGWKTGVTVADINEDGWMDIYVCRSAAQNPALRKNLLYLNNQDNTFTEAAAQFGLDDSGYSTQAVFFDYDRDGDLDCFVLNHSVQEYAGFSKNLASFKKTKDPRYSSRLLQNNKGQFSDVTAEAGLVSNILSFGLGVLVSDYNDDGWLDIYVSNDYNEEDYLYLNNQKGGFEESIRKATAYTSLFSMGLDAADVNNDGTMDIVSLDMLPASNYRLKMTSGDDNYLKYSSLLQNGFHKQYMRNMLQLNQGNRSDTGGIAVPYFAETGQLAGISNTDWSWSALLADFDLDGYKDLFVTNGYEKDYTNMDFLAYTVDLQMKAGTAEKPVNQLDVIQKMPSIKVPNQVFENDGNGIFEDKTHMWGFDENTVSAGAMYADFDNDGDWDIVVNNLNTKASIHENTFNQPSFKVSLLGEKQSLAIGAKIGVFVNGKVQYQEYMPTRGFQSAAQQPLIFAMNGERVDSVVVRWANGTSNVYQEPFMEGILVARQEPEQKKAFAFDEIVPLESFGMKYTPLTDNDFDIQPLLPFMQSDWGPHMSAKDNLVFVTGNAYTPMQLYEKKSGTFSLINFPFKANTFPASAVKLVDWDKDGDTDVWIGLNGYRNSGSEKTLYYYENQGDNTFLNKEVYPVQEKIVSVGALECTDLNGDGLPDLVVGSGVTPHGYPYGAVTLVCLNNNSRVEKQIYSLNLGLIRDLATIRQDGHEKVLVAGEWQPIRMLSFEDAECQLDTIGPTGLWQSIVVDTFGQEPQIWVGNLGLNNQLAAITDTMLELYTLSLDNSLIPLLCYFQEGKSYPFAARDELLAQLPSLKKKFTSFDAYAHATVRDVIPELNQAPFSAQTLESGTLSFSNNQWHFEPLPPTAQKLMVRAIVPTSESVYLFGNQKGARVRIGDLDIQGGMKMDRDSQLVRFIPFRLAVSDAIWFDNELLAVGK